MAKAWCLLLTRGKAQPLRRVGGLPLVLRLALDAQRAGATSIVLTAPSRDVEFALKDSRLKLSILAQPDKDQALVEVPDCALIHEATWTRLASEAIAGQPPVNLARIVAQPLAPWGFSPFTTVDESNARMAERLLFRSLRKVQDGWTARWFNRYISLGLSRLLAKTRLRPNQISLSILAIGLAGAALATRGSYFSLFWGATLFQLQSVLDGCDGEISRVTYQTSRRGEWLDTIGDDLTNYAFFVGASVGLYRADAQIWPLAAGAIVLGAGLIASGFEYAYLIRIGSGDLLKYPLSQATTGRTGPAKSLAPLFKRDTFVMVTWVAAALGQIGPILIVFAAAALGVLASVIGTEVRLARERRSVTRPP